MSLTDFDDDQSDGIAPRAGAVAGTEPAQDGSGLPGYPLDGYPDWRAGVPGPNGGVLGMVKVSDLRPGLSTDGSASAKSAALGDYETNNWRWNDPNALAYDLDRKQRQLAQAQTMTNMAEAAGPVGTLLGASKPVALGISAFGGVMGHVETARLQTEIKALQDRLYQLRSPQ